MIEYFLSLVEDLSKFKESFCMFGASLYPSLAYSKYSNWLPLESMRPVVEFNFMIELIVVKSGHWLNFEVNSL